MESILSIIGVFFVPAAMVILIVWFRSNEKRKRYELQADLYAKAIEKGQSVPTDWFTEPKKKSKALNTGIICIAVGIGLSLFFWLISVFFAQVDATASAVFLSFSSVGIIPFLIGVAYVIIHFIEKKKDNVENAE
jgi:hypothetical protein